MRLARVPNRLRAADEPTLPKIARYGSGRILGEMAVQPANGIAAGVRDLLDGELGIGELRLDIGLDPLQQVVAASDLYLFAQGVPCHRGDGRAQFSSAGTWKTAHLAEALVHHGEQDPGQSRPAVPSM